VGSTGRYTFTNPGERVLDAWLARHAFVTWVGVDRPWDVEREVLASSLSLPLNLSGRRASENAVAISAARSAARRKADALPTILDSGGPRTVPTVVTADADR
jgi:hypothetical protein